MISSAISKLGEDRALEITEGAPAVLVLIHHLGADDVGGHEVGRKLDAAGFQPEHDAERVDELGLGEPRHADEKGVAAGKNGDQRAFDDAFLTENDGADRLAYQRDVGKCLFRLGDHRLRLRRLLRLDDAHGLPRWLDCRDWGILQNIVISPTSADKRPNGDYFMAAGGRRPAREKIAGSANGET